jgi:ribosomal protein S12 methylthiotransferase accessory factor
MIIRPRFKQCFRYEVIPLEGVVLQYERGHFLLPGNVYIRLAPLLDGQHTVDEIFACLQDEVPAVEIFQALATLQSKKFIVDIPPPLPSEQAAFWDMADVNVGNAVQRLRETTVSLASFGAIDSAPFRDILTSLGIRIGNKGECCVVLTDDYLRPELNVFNQDALVQNRPWLLIKPVGVELWIGPLFLPGKTGCWACLAHRLRGARKVENYLWDKSGSFDLHSLSLAVLPSTFHTGLNIAATETAKWVSCGHNEALEGRIVTFNTLSLTTQTHTLVQRPQCPYCGDPQMVATQQAAPLVLQSRKKMFTNDCGPRSLTSEDIVKKLEHHISPLTGIVHTLRPTSTWTGEDSLTPSYVTGHNFIYVAKDDSLDFVFLDASLHGGSSGKGKHSMQARAGALCESIERYSGLFQGDEARLRARCKDLETAAIHPNACMLFSEPQFRNREQWNASSLPAAWVPEPFDVDAEIEWSPVWSLTYGEPRYVPTAYCYYGYSRKHNAWFARADANGCAAGHSKEEAILHGLIELVERDSVALWWYNKLKKPAVDLSSFAEPYFQQLQAYYQTLHRDLWVLDVTSDLNVSTFVAISRRNDHEDEAIMFGFGAHLDPQIAILRALTELNLQLPLLHSIISENNDGTLCVDSRVISWWKTAKLENHPYLAPDVAVLPRMREDYPQRASDDFYTDVMTCVQKAEEKGLETLVLDQTRPDTGLIVVKVLVPGLRHFWPRFGPGRLYDVPVQMGWLTEPLTEDQLNSQPIYLSFQS